MKSAKRVATNTLILYGRMVLTVGISLYSTRLVLDSLGVVDYGIFNLIGGVIALLAFLNTSLATSTQRFLSFYQGKNNLIMQKKVFVGSLLLHFFIAVGIVIFLRLLEDYLFLELLNVPDQRISSARTVYLFMSLTVFVTIITVPFTGSLTANENMLWIAFINIAESLLKLGIAIFLTYVKGDKLLVYGSLSALVGLVGLLMSALYCVSKYPECSLKIFRYKDNETIKELTSFIGWNSFGAFCFLARSQGLPILLNLFFGTVINAAYAISNQISTQLNFFSVTLLRVLNPQIMKSAGANDTRRMLVLSMMTSKAVFFLLSFIAIPCIFEMPFLLKFWLTDYPNHTVEFCRLILVGMMVSQITIGLHSTALAIGKIRTYQLATGIISLSNLPISYLFLKSDFPPYCVFINYILLEILAGGVRLYLIKKLTNLSIREFFSRVILKVLFPILSAISVCYLISQYVDFLYRFVITTGLSILAFTVSIYLTGLCDDEKKILFNILVSVKEKLVKKTLKPTTTP